MKHTLNFSTYPNKIEIAQDEMLADSAKINYSGQINERITVLGTLLVAAIAFLIACIAPFVKNQTLQIAVFCLYIVILSIQIVQFKEKKCARHLLSG